MRYLRILAITLALIQFAYVGATLAQDRLSDSAAAVVLIDQESDVLSLDVYTDGNTVHLLTAEVHAKSDPAALYYRRSTDQGTTWSKPVRVDTGAKPPHHPHRGADAQIAAKGNTLIAAWTTRGAGYAGSGPLATARSTNGGLSWQPGPNPADDGTTTGHGYIDIMIDAQGFHMIWRFGGDENRIALPGVQRRGGCARRVVSGVRG